MFPPSVKYLLPIATAAEGTCAVKLLTDSRRLHALRYSSAIVSVTSHLNNLIRRLSQLRGDRTSLLEPKMEALAFLTSDISELFLDEFENTNRYEAC
jgi:hypothetical protein